jgi:pilus assembly protein CpaF
MSTLNERLAKVNVASGADLEGAQEQPTTMLVPTPGRRSARPGDPFAGLKRRVHQGLVEALGPKLYDANLSAGEL